MRTSYRSRVIGVAGLATVGLALGLSGSACKSDRAVFGGSEGTFVDEPVDAGECPLQCSLDGRSVVRSCDGESVETCAADLACGAAACQEPCAAAAADRSSNGCEFFFQIPRYDRAKYVQSCAATFVVNTSQKPAEITLTYEGKELDLSGALFRTNPGDATLIPHSGPIAPGESAILFLSDRDPNAVRLQSPDEDYRIACPFGVVPALRAELVGGTRIASAMHLTANVPVGLSMIYPFGGAASYISSATLLLPVPTWAKQNIIINGWEANISSPASQIYAAEDDTEITILPTADVQDGVGVKGTRKKVPVTYRLDKGQFLQLVQREELSGSIIESTKPVATFGGHGCAFVPSGSSIGACDTLHQQIPSFEQWGSEYVGVGYRPRMGNEREPMGYRIVAARDGTQLDYDPEIPPGAPTTLSAGEVALFLRGTGDAFVVRTQDADHPIYVGAYMSSSGTGFNKLEYNGAGDPEFVNVVPSGQYLSSFSFYSDPTYGDSSLVIVRAKMRGEFKDVWLECAGENLSDFRPIGTRGEYEFTRVDLAKNGGPGQKFGDRVCQNGLQRLKSDGPFTATVWGWDAYASYAYPGGMALRKLVQTPLDPIR